VTHVIAGNASVPVVTHVILGDKPVTGVTSLGDDVLVICHDQSQQVAVYDAVTFTLQRRLSVPGLGYSEGLAACASNKCLYAPDCFKNHVHKVELTGSNALTKWSVGGRPTGLTVNSAKNVMVLIRDVRKLKEFTTHGSLLQTIQLQPNIERPRQVIELTSGQFVISHTGTHHRVCLLDVQGSVVQSYGGILGSDLTKMNEPGGLAMDKHGNILVADVLNNKLLVLDRSLTSAHEMAVSVDGGLKRPFSLWYDKSRGRLYVGEWHGRRRVIIIDHLKDFTTSHVSPQS